MDNEEIQRQRRRDQQNAIIARCEEIITSGEDVIEKLKLAKSAHRGMGFDWLFEEAIVKAKTTEQVRARRNEVKKFLYLQKGD